MFHFNGKPREIPLTTGYIHMLSHTYREHRRLKATFPSETAWKKSSDVLTLPDGSWKLSLGFKCILTVLCQPNYYCETKAFVPVNHCAAREEKTRNTCRWKEKQHRLGWGWWTPKPKNFPSSPLQPWAAIKGKETERVGTKKQLKREKIARK